jgi:tetratricopeptide (TPR) repeat protein
VNISTDVFNFRAFLALFRPDLYTPYELALRDIARGRLAEGLARLDALLVDPVITGEDRAAICNKRGVALVQLSRREDARAAFESALEARAQFVPALVNLGNLQLESGDAQEAVRYYEIAIRSDEEYALAHHNLGVAYKRLGRTGDAVGELRKADRLEGRQLTKQRK